MRPRPGSSEVRDRSSPPMIRAGSRGLPATPVGEARRPRPAPRSREDERPAGAAGARRPRSAVLRGCGRVYSGCAPTSADSRRARDGRATRRASAATLARLRRASRDLARVGVTQRHAVAATARSRAGRGCVTARAPRRTAACAGSEAAPTLRTATVGARRRRRRRRAHGSAAPGRARDCGGRLAATRRSPGPCGAPPPGRRRGRSRHDRRRRRRPPGRRRPRRLGGDRRRLGGDRRRLGDDRRRRRHGLRAARRQQAERVDVAVGVGGDAHAEVDVRRRRDRVGALADAPTTAPSATTLPRDDAVEPSCSSVTA